MCKDNTYSEFHLVNKDINCEKNGVKIGCDYCILPSNYENIVFTKINDGISQCNYCRNFISQDFKGKEQLIKDLDLKDTEKVGVMVSGGKDSIYLWMWLVENIGANRVVAFNHNKVGLVHKYATDNISKAQKILGSELVVVDDYAMYNRFKNNLEAFLDKPEPAMVRAAFCAGCRYGITIQLYQKGKEFNVSKFVSGASYLELAPFKAELMKKKGLGNEKYGLISGLADNSKYNFDNNIEIMLRDDDLAYKSRNNNKNSDNVFKEFHLFDFDEYFENNPQYYEKEVSEKLGWKRPERSWHFDCLIENFKDFFYYGLLGYTETDFKLSQMIRYNLISRNDALKELYIYRNRMKNYLGDIIALLEEIDMMCLKEKVIEFYNNSKYFNNKEI